MVSRVKSMYVNAYVRVKGKEGVDVFKKGKLKLFALTETKMKGDGEVPCCRVNSIIAGIQEVEWARDNVE